MLRSLKIAQTKVRNTLNVFNPRRYTPEVVKTNKDSWIKKAEDAFDIVAELSLDLEECVSKDEAQEILTSNEALMDEIAKFVFSINTAALSNDDLHPHSTETNFDDDKNQPKLDRVRFSTFSGKNENALKANEMNEEDHDEQSQCLESEPRGSIRDSIKNLLLHECSQEAANEVEEEHHRSLGEKKDVQFSYCFQNLFKLISVDQRFHRHVSNYGMLRSVLCQFPIQEMHVLLQMSSGSIQRGLNYILNYIQLARYVDSMSYILSVPTNANPSL